MHLNYDLFANLVDEMPRVGYGSITRLEMGPSPITFFSVKLGYIQDEVSSFFDFKHNQGYVVLRHCLSPKRERALLISELVRLCSKKEKLSERKIEVLRSASLERALIDYREP